MQKYYVSLVALFMATLISCTKSEPTPPPAGKPILFKVSFVVNEFPQEEIPVSHVWLVISKGDALHRSLLKYELTKNGDYYTTALEREVVSDENCRFHFIANADLIPDFPAITTSDRLLSTVLPELKREPGIRSRYVMGTKRGYKPVITDGAILLESVPFIPTVACLAFEYRNQLSPIGKIRVTGTLQRGNLYGFFDSEAGVNESAPEFTITEDCMGFDGMQGGTGVGYCYVYPGRDTPVKIGFETAGHSRMIALPQVEPGGTYPLILRDGVLLAYRSDAQIEYSESEFLFPRSEVWLDMIYEEGGSFESQVAWLSFENTEVITKGMSITTRRLRCEANLSRAERRGTITLRGIDGQEEVFYIRQRGDLNNPAGIEYVEIPAGSFIMGSPVWELNRDVDEVQHPVLLSKGFEMSKYEITNAQFCLFLNALHRGITPLDAEGRGMVVNPKEIEYMDGNWRSRAGKECFPMVNVTWYGAAAFAKWAGGELPTEAQWEYACRGRSENKSAEFHTKPFGVGSGEELNRSLGHFLWRFPYSQLAGEYADPTAETPMAPTGVGETVASVNNYGLYDMHGNVWEWCRDHYDPSYGGSGGVNPVVDPNVFVQGAHRVLRGGSWYYYARSCRSAFRMKAPEETAADQIGFRIIR